MNQKEERDGGMHGEGDSLIKPKAGKALWWQGRTPLVVHQYLLEIAQ